jgi:hypothetical protein
MLYLRSTGTTIDDIFGNLNGYIKENSYNLDNYLLYFIFDVD